MARSTHRGEGRGRRGVATSVGSARLLGLSLLLLSLACDPPRERPVSGARPRASDASVGVDGSSAGDTGSGSDDALVQVDAAPVDDGGGEGDGASPADGGGWVQDGGVGQDVPPPFDAGAPVDAGPPPPPPAGTVAVNTSCGADFGGEIVVSFNGSFGVGALRNGFQLVSSLQFDLAGQSGTITLGTQHRIQTGLVVNLVIGSTWTNLSQDVDVITGAQPDTIGGQLVVHNYQPQAGIVDIDLVNVRLQNASDLSFCTLNGNVSTNRLGR